MERSDARKRRTENEAAQTPDIDGEWAKWAADVRRLSQLDEELT